MTRSRCFVLGVVVALASGAVSMGQTVHYRASLTDFEGAPIPDGHYSVWFALWTQDVGGELVWQEELGDVAVEAGKSLVELGDSVPLPLDSNGLWLELIVSGGPLGPRAAFLLPSTRLAVAGSVEVYGEFLALFNPVKPSMALSVYPGPTGGGQNDSLVGNFAAGNLHFQTQNTPANVPQVRFAIRNTGIVDVLGGSGASLNNGSGYLVLGLESGSNLVLDNNEIMARNNGASSTLFLQANGGAVWVNGALVHASDARLKRDVRSLETGLAEVLALRPVSFEWKNGEDGRHFGLIAQEVRELSKSLVYEDEQGFLGVAYADLVPLLICALQEQEQRIGKLQANVEELQARSPGGGH